MYTLAIANQKGGVGKTTTAAAIAQGLTAAGYKVLSIDADPQRNFSDMMQAEAGKSLCDVIQGAPAETVIQATAGGDLIPTVKALASPKLQITPSTLQKILTPLQRKYDVCIIDTPPSLGALTVSAIMAADGIIVPTIADKFSLSGLQEVYTSAKAIKPQLALVGVIVTQFDNTNIDKAVLEALQQQAKIYHSAVIMPPIRRTTNARRWQYTGEIYKGRSTAGKDYAEVVNQIPKLIKLKKRR